MQADRSLRGRSDDDRLQQASPHADEWPSAVFKLRRSSKAVLWASAAAAELFELGAWAQQAPPWWWRAGQPAPPGWAPVVQLLLEAEPGRRCTGRWSRLVDGQAQTWQLNALGLDEVMVVQAIDVTDLLREELLKVQDAQMQGDLLVREVHHRLKNNLQGVCGLLRQKAAGHPLVASALEDAAAQLQAMAQVYGLQMNGGPAPRPVDLLRAVARGIESFFGVTLEVREPVCGAVPQMPDPGAAGADQADLRRMLFSHLETADGSSGSSGPSGARPAGPAHLHPDQVGALALVVNELLTNAVKHARAADRTAPQGAAGSVVTDVTRGVSAEVQPHDQGVLIEIRNPGSMVQASAAPGSVAPTSGLALVRALLPRRGARFSLHSQDGWVCARLHLAAPLLIEAGPQP